MGWQNISIPSRVVRGVKFTYILSTRVKTLIKLWFPGFHGLFCFY